MEVPQRYAFINCIVYLGQGDVIEKGFVLWHGERIEDVGVTRDFVRSPDTEVIDLRGNLLLPGLVDSHIHLVKYAKSLIEPNLADTQTLREGLEVARAYLARMPKGVWLSGRGWDKQRWRLSGFPTRWMLDGIAPENPVSLTSRDGHLVWLNSAALVELGLADRAIPVEGGEIVVDDAGKPTGILKENAANLIPKESGAQKDERIVDAIRQASEGLACLGLTGIHTVETEADAHLLTKAVGKGYVSHNLFRLREVVEPDEIDALAPSPEVACIKTYADGALGSQTASMLEPYCGQPGNLGIPVASKDKLREIVLRALDKGFAVTVHAIGDRANMETLDVYEEARRDRKYHDALLRVEHVQVLRSEDISRFGRLGVIASMQPVHLVSDRDVADKCWGARSRNAYAWKRIMESGGRVAFGSDAPIESPDPLKGIHAAVTRSNPAKPDQDPWYPQERIEVWQAVDCYTTGAARASAMDQVVSRVGARSAFTILDENILAMSNPDAILSTHVAGTVIGGEPRLYS